MSGKETIRTKYQTTKLQKPDYLHILASSKAIPAHLSRERVEEMIERHASSVRL